MESTTDGTTEDLFYATSGPRDASIVLVGESWGREELIYKKPFIGQSGEELNLILAEAGLDRDKILCTNVVNTQPPRNELERIFNPYSRDVFSYRGLNPTDGIMREITRLYNQIDAYPRKLIIAAGNWSLWSLSDVTGVGSKTTSKGVTTKVPTGITSWRGSHLYTSTLKTQTKLLPILHPAAILREWKWRAVTVQDLRRVEQINEWWPKVGPDIVIPKNAEECIFCLEELLQQLAKGLRRISNDIETHKGLITCIGFAEGGYNDEGKALVIPLIRAEGTRDIREFTSWWNSKSEARITHLLRAILCHPNILLEGQNYIYDTQYFIRWLGVQPRCDFDTMLAQHLLFPGTPKGLDFLSSLYCTYHRYWKDDGKDWNITGNQEKNLIYNGEDCLRTYECATILRSLITQFKMEKQWENEKQKWLLALKMMLRGIRIDMEHRTKLRKEIFLEQQRVHARLGNLIPHSIVPKLKTSKVPWFASPKQQQMLFYDILGLEGKTHRKTGRTSINDESLNLLEEQYPELRTIFAHIRAERSLGVFRSNFLDAEVDHDNHMRTSFNPAGSETFRWSSSANAFGGGTNLQNIPKGDEE
jgi:uracil-DNA glycosylase